MAIRPDWTRIRRGCGTCHQCGKAVAPDPFSDISRFSASEPHDIHVPSWGGVNPAQVCLSRSTDAQDRDRGAPSYIDPPSPRTAVGPASLRVPRRRPEMPNQRFDVVVQGPKMEIFDHPDDCSVVVPGHDKLLADGVLQTEPRRTPGSPGGDPLISAVRAADATTSSVRDRAAGNQSACCHQWTRAELHRWTQRRKRTSEITALV